MGSELPKDKRESESSIVSLAGGQASRKKGLMLSWVFGSVVRSEAEVDLLMGARFRKPLACDDASERAREIAVAGAADQREQESQIADGRVVLGRNSPHRAFNETLMK